MFRALPWTVKILPFSDSSSARSMPLVRGREPTSSAMLTPSKASSGLSCRSRFASRGKAQSTTSIATPSSAPIAGGISKQAQVDRLVGAEQLAGGDAEEQAVADLPGGAGDGDSYGVAH